MARYDLHATDDPDRTLGEAGVLSSHRSLIAAANAFVECPLPCKQLVYVADCGEPRYLTEREEAIVDQLAADLGLEVIDL